MSRMVRRRLQASSVTAAVILGLIFVFIVLGQFLNLAGFIVLFILAAGVVALCWIGGVDGGSIKQVDDSFRKVPLGKELIDEILEQPDEPSWT